MIWEEFRWYFKLYYLFSSTRRHHQFQLLSFVSAIEELKGIKFEIHTWEFLFYHLIKFWYRQSSYTKSRGSQIDLGGDISDDTTCFKKFHSTEKCNAKTTRTTILNVKEEEKIPWKNIEILFNERVPRVSVKRVREASTCTLRWGRRGFFLEK